jgi:hypothetical protein
MALSRKGTGQSSPKKKPTTGARSDAYGSQEEIKLEKQGSQQSKAPSGISAVKSDK